MAVPHDVDWALGEQKVLCDLFERYIAAETTADLVRTREAITHRFINGGEEAMHVLANAVVASV